MYDYRNQPQPPFARYYNSFGDDFDTGRDYLSLDVNIPPGYGADYGPYCYFKDDWGRPLPWDGRSRG